MDQQDKLLEELRVKAAQLVEAKSTEKSKTDIEDKKDSKKSEIEFDDDETKDDKKECDESESTEDLSDLVEETEEIKEGFKMEDLNIESIFECEELSEEFKIKATALFETAVAQKVSALEESYAKAMEEFKAEQTQAALNESAEFTEGLVERVDGYLDFMVEQWMKNNELALERGIKADLFESFMTGMKGLYEEHNISMPEDRIEVMEELVSENEELGEKIDDVIAENIELKQMIRNYLKEQQIMEAADGLSDLEVERFVELAQSLTYENEEVFGQKLGVIREQFFAQTDDSKHLVEQVVVSDEPLIVEEKSTPYVDPQISAYVSALSRIQI